jgi:hypothetical protein
LKGKPPSGCIPAKASRNLTESLIVNSSLVNSYAHGPLIKADPIK